MLGISDENDTGLNPGVLNRYNAFRVGDFYNERLIQLTRRRLGEDGIIQAVNYTTDCDPKGVNIVRNVTLGDAREVRVGFGGSTEEGPRIKLSARQSRLGTTASSASANAEASLRQQFFNMSVRWYYSHKYVSRFIEPLLSIDHSKEEHVESQTSEAKVVHG